MADKIMIVRHAEKPIEHPPESGVDEDGVQAPESLTVRGWRRAGALACLFAAHGAAPRPGLAAPAAIFATAVARHARSLRPQQTVAEVAALLGLEPDFTRFTVGDEPALAAAASEAAGPVLIGWHHENIPDIADAILGNAATVPRKWSDDRFDLVWVFDRDGAGWRFSQVPQLVLKGDSEAPIPR